MQATLLAQSSRLLRDVAQGLGRRAGRTALTGLTTAVGVGALVAILGISQSAGSAIDSSLEGVESTEIRITAAGQSESGAAAPIDWTEGSALATLNGVRAVGGYAEIASEQVWTVLPQNSAERRRLSATALALSAGALAAADVEVLEGRLFDAGHDRGDDAIAIVGVNLAHQLELSRVDRLPVVFFGDHPLQVIGIVRPSDALPELSNAVILSSGFASKHGGLENWSAILVRTAPGWLEVVAAQAPFALRPAQPGSLSVELQPVERELSRRISEQLRGLLVAVGLLSVGAGVLSVANVTLLSVLERTAEIGLRRALGASRAQIALLFVAEAAAIGLAAGLLGTFFGTIAVVAVTETQGWAPEISAWALVGPAPLAGAAGVIAGLYPAGKAALVEPIDALRTGA